MAKFYVQSGSFRGVVDCFDEECAAVWAVHRTMQRIPDLTPDLIADDDNENWGDAMFELNDVIEINEQGFDREDSVQIDLHLAFIQWHQLKKAIDAISKTWNDRLAE